MAAASVARDWHGWELASDQEKILILKTKIDMVMNVTETGVDVRKQEHDTLVPEYTRTSLEQASMAGVVEQTRLQLADTAGKLQMFEPMVENEITVVTDFGNDLRTKLQVLSEGIAAKVEVVDSILKQSITQSGSIMNDGRILNTNLVEVSNKMVQAELEIGQLKAAIASSEAKLI